MTNLIQMIYISRSTFAPAELSNGIEPNVARILLKSRANNKKNGSYFNILLCSLVPIAFQSNILFAQICCA